MPVFSTTELLYYMVLATTPADRWMSASAPFKSIHGGGILTVIVPIISIVCVVSLYTRYHRALRSQEKRIDKLSKTVVKFLHENNELKIINEQLRHP